MGIPVVVDLPVGDNLQDHITSGLSFVLNDSVSFDLLKASTPYALLDYYLFKKNELTSNLIESTIFVKTKYEDKSDDWPDIQLGMIPGIEKEITQFILFMLIYDVWKAVTTYRLMHTNEKNAFKVSILLNTIKLIILKQNITLY